MALSNQTDPKLAERQLTDWLATKLGDARDVRVSGARVPTAAGLSAETILFDAGWVDSGGSRARRLAARVQPSGEAVFPSYDFEAEFRVMTVLGEAGLAVPEVLWHERDRSILGGEFIVMEQIDGRVPGDDPTYTTAGWVLELSPEAQATLYDNALQALAAVHTVDWRAAGIDLPGDGATPRPGLDRQLEYWERTFEWASGGKGDANATIEGALDWVRENRPVREERLVLNWGDARLGNILFAEDLSVAAVLDWEMAAVASPELDLGWWLFLIRLHTEGIGAPVPAGFPTREATVARYEQLSGLTVSDLEFYEVFAALRMAIIMHRAGDLMIRAGLLPPDATMKLNNPTTQLLAEQLGLPAPTGAVQDFVGNR
jgi:aminoglycoside phosphotransferase (APT) family kinase protein